MRSNPRWLLVGALAVAPAAPLAAQAGAEAGQEARATVGDDDIEALARARWLAARGSRTRSAEPLVEAARILLDIPPPKCCRDFVPPLDDAEPERDVLRVGSTPRSFLAVARSLVSEGSPLLDEIAALEARLPPPRTRGDPPPAVEPGAADGPWREEGRVGAGDRQLWEISFEADVEATVLVMGDRGTNLDLYVYDADGNLVGLDDDLSDDGEVRWVPSTGGRYQIVVDNRGRRTNEYWLVTN